MLRLYDGNRDATVQGRNLAITLAAATAVLGLGTYVVEQARVGTERMESVRLRTMGGQVVASPPPQVATDAAAVAKGASGPEAQVAEVSGRLRESLTDRSDRARAAAMAEGARAAIVEGNQVRFDGFMYDLATLERSARAECTVRADLGADGRPEIGQDFSGKSTLKGTCWAPGPGDIQRTYASGTEHATDFPCDAEVGSKAEAERLASSFAASDYVYGVKVKGEIGVRWASPALRPMASR